MGDALHRDVVRAGAPDGSVWGGLRRPTARVGRLPACLRAADAEVYCESILLIIIMILIESCESTSGMAAAAVRVQSY